VTGTEARPTNFFGFTAGPKAQAQLPERF